MTFEKSGVRPTRGAPGRRFFLDDSFVFAFRLRQCFVVECLGIKRGGCLLFQKFQYILFVDVELLHQFVEFGGGNQVAIFIKKIDNKI